MSFKKFSFLFVLFFWFWALAGAYTYPGEPVGFVNDYAGLLDIQQKQDLEIKLSEFEKQTTNEIAVVTIKSLAGDTIENFAVRLFEDWEIGKKEKDNGLLILVALEDREMRIEVGYGLEGSLTDAQAFYVINKIMKPAFQEENYYQGLDRAVDKIIVNLTGGEIIPEENYYEELAWGWKLLVVAVLIYCFMAWLASVLSRSRSWWGGGVVGLIFALFFTIGYGFLFIGLIALLVLVPLGLLFDFIVSRAYKKGKEKGKVPWWAGGWGRGSGSSRSSGGFGGFGGGSSGGGGASGRW